MKKRIFAAFFALLVLASALPTSVFAENGSTDADTQPPLIIDDMFSGEAWSSDGFSLSSAVYTEENSHLASSDTDRGYSVFSSDSVEANTDASLSRIFEEKINLYGYAFLSFDYFISPSDTTSDAVYTMTVTAHAGDTSVSSSFAAAVGEWTNTTLSLSGWSKRSAVDSVSVSVSPSLSSGADAVSVLLCVDNLRAEGTADTVFEDRYMTPAFTAKSGAVNINADGSVSWNRSSYSSLSASISYSSPSEALGDNTLRAVLSASKETELYLTVFYEDDSTYKSDPIKINADTAPFAYYFSIPSPEKAVRFGFVCDSRSGGTVGIHGIDTLYMPVGTASASTLGTLDVCAFGADGSLNLRGTIASDAVANHIDGTLRIYAVPMYAAAEEVIAASAPIAEATMSTRYNITVEADRLPDGAYAMRYAAVIADGDEIFSVASLRLPDTDKAGAALPSGTDSLKGITNADISISAGLTELTVDLSALFGSPSTSKIYSLFGELYYFDSAVLAQLDASVKSLSLSGTDVYLRFVSLSDGTPTLITADTREDFRRLYAAVDYLTSRYSSADFGYVSGAVLGASVTDTSEGKASEDAIKSLVASAAVIRGAGTANIAGFRVLLPLGDSFVSLSPTLSSAELSMRLIAFYAEELGLADYGIMWQTDAVSSDNNTVGTDGIDRLNRFAGSLHGTAASFWLVKYTPSDLGYPSAASLMRSAVRAYYSLCSQTSPNGFILDTYGLPNLVLTDEFFTAFTLLDTNLGADTAAKLFSGDTSAPVLPAAAEKRAFSRSVTETSPLSGVSTLGQTLLFDYTDAFYTGGWFTLTEGGECMTVKADTGRAMRFSGGIMLPYAAKPLDISSAPILSFDIYADSERTYTLTVLSKSLSVSAPITVGTDEARISLDLSDFGGASSVTAILLTPTDGAEGFAYIKRIAVGSNTYTSDQLAAIFDESSVGSDTEEEAEKNIVELVALISAVAIVSALALVLFRRKAQ